MKKPLILIIIFSLVTISSPYAFGAIKTGSKCKEKDYNRGTKIKVGKKTYTCIGADSGYFWYPATSRNNSSGYDQILGLPAQNYVYSGLSLQAVQISLGISLNNGTRPITLKELGEKIYTASCRLAGSWLSKNDVQVSLQPGNGLYNLLAGLMTNQAAFDAIAYEITRQGAKH
jgi:hypothetical protein